MARTIPQPGDPFPPPDFDPNAIPKNFSWASYCPARYPQFKAHSTRGPATNACWNHSRYGGAALYERQGGKWVLFAVLPPGTEHSSYDQQVGKYVSKKIDDFKVQPATPVAAPQPGNTAVEKDTWAITFTPGEWNHFFKTLVKGSEVTGDYFFLEEIQNQIEAQRAATAE